jgi:hypothetical protein
MFHRIAGGSRGMDGEVVRMTRTTSFSRLLE